MVQVFVYNSYNKIYRQLLKIYLFQVIIIKNELIDRSLIKKKKKIIIIEELLETVSTKKNEFIIQRITRYSLRDLDELIVHDLIMIT